MNPTLTIYAYGNVDALHGIFNAIAMIMNSGDFAQMMRLALVIGFAVVATLSMMPGHFQKGWTWFLAVTVVTLLMLGPKATVSIVDRTGEQGTVTVGNVPWTLALMASVKSSIGVTLTETFETAFQTIPTGSRALPSELSYLSHGMMFGSRLVRATRDAAPANLYDHGDLIQFIRNCVLPEQGRLQTPNQMANSTDLTAVMNNTNPALASGYHDPDRAWRLEIQPCPVVWNQLQGRLAAASSGAVAKAAANTMPGLFQINRTAATAAVDGGISAIYGKAALADAGASASQIMLQNILINATADAVAVRAASLNDPATMMLAMMRTQAVAQMNAGNIVQGRIAEEALPMVRNITEGILFACFPILVILLVASEPRVMGTLFKSYGYTLIWVELWPLMFAVVNYLQTLAAAKQLAGAAYMAGAQGLSVSTASAVFSTSVSSVGTTAWMVTFVPVLAAAVLFGFDKVMAVTGATGGGMRAAQSEAANSTKGNQSMGNVSFDQQQLAAYRTSPSMYTSRSIGGTEEGDLMSGDRVSSYASSRHLSSASALASIGEGVGVAATDALASAQRNSKGYETSIDAAYNAARSALQGYGSAATARLGYDISKIGSDGLAASEVDEEAKRIATQHGISDSSAIRKQLGLALGGLPASLIGINAQGSTAEAEELRRSFASSVDSLHKKGLSRKQEIAESFRSGEGFEEARRSNSDASQRVESSLREAAGYKEATSQDLTRSRQLSSEWQAFQRFAQSQSTDFSNLVEREYMRRGWSVHDGVADPRKHAQVVRSLFEQGSFRMDGPNGEPMFIPEPKGPGPTRIQPREALDLAASGRSGLTAEFDASTPGGGREGVQRQALGNDARERTAESRLGVSPTAVVAGEKTKSAVAAGQDRAGAATDQAADAARTAQSDAQLAYDSRARNLGTAHAPVLNVNPATGAPIRNPALDGVRGADGSSPRQFPDAAATEQAKRDKAAADFADASKSPNAQIPKARNQ
jgi:conjugal transfer mating pair stabilization protein TraG